MNWKGGAAEEGFFRRGPARRMPDERRRRLRIMDPGTLTQHNGEEIEIFAVGILHKYVETVTNVARDSKTRIFFKKNKKIVENFEELVYNSYALN